MDIRNSTLIHSVFIFLCIGCAHNKRRKPRSNLNEIISEPMQYYLNSLQLIMKFNYKAEKHSVITQQGYVVNLFRIPNKGPPVLLVHGICDSSDSWLLLGPKYSIAYQLADAGYDVWLFNSRGNKYSKKHTTHISDKEFWNFSYEEIGSQDLAATIDYILLKTSQDKLSYVGFSQGTTLFIVLCSMKPEYNDKIKQAILLAPVAWVTRIKYPLLDLLTQNLKELTFLAERDGLHEVFATNSIRNLYHSIICVDSSPAKLLCDVEFRLSYGLMNVKNLPRGKLPVIASHIPAGTSAKNFVHVLQGYGSKMFQRFDYGLENNQMVYGSPQPPAYNVSLVTAPITLFYSEIDTFSSVEDVTILRSKLPNVVNSIMLNKTLDFTHLEFVYGARVKAIINDRVLRLLSDVK